MTNHTARKQAQEARTASRALNQLSSNERAQLLNDVATALLSQQVRIISANQEDLADAQQAVNEGRLAAELYNRLKIDRNRLESLADGIRSIASMPEPIDKFSLIETLGQDCTCNKYPHHSVLCS